MTTTTPTPTSRAPKLKVAQPTLAEMAAAPKTGRNRAVDLYRAVAMLAVAGGHWLAIVAYRSDGELIAGNALEFVPSMSWITWVLQVMPLFFVVGGFASAASLDSKGDPSRTVSERRSDWIAGRLARLLPPVAALAKFWLVAIAIGLIAGFGSLVAAGAYAAAIPLWFLANYIADIIIAPYVLPLFRRAPGKVAVGALALFSLLEGMRLAGDRGISHINWVLGWFLFQIAGFAWKDGLLPTGRALLAWAAGFWTAALALVTLGPWPVTMVGFGGLEHNPTHPPTLALIVFGAAQSATAIYFAPRVTAFLERNAGAWKAVIGANSFTMTIYLWHMTAATLVLAAMDAAGVLPSATPGSTAWWIAKLPLIAACLAVMGLIVPKLSKIERSSLLSAKAPWAYSAPALVVGAIVTSTALKLWTSGHSMAIVPAMLVVVTASRFLNRTVSAEATVSTGATV